MEAGSLLVGGANFRAKLSGTVPREPIDPGAQAIGVYFIDKKPPGLSSPRKTEGKFSWSPTSVRQTLLAGLDNSFFSEG